MASTKVVFLTGLKEALIEEVVSYSPPDYEVVVLDKSSTEEQRINEVRDADFLLCYGQDPSDEVIKSLEKCRLVQLLAAGYDRMNLDLLAELEIPCANNGGANSWAVADQAVLLMLAIYKQLLASDNSTREGRWAEPITGQNTFEMADKKVGILGIGNIGRQVAKRVQGFDAKVQYFDLYPLDERTAEELNVTYVSLDELFSTSDIISCHTPLTNDTKHIVNSNTLSLMKPTAILINTSRGPVVDEEALISALQSGVIAAAGLDVFEKEPVSPDNPLLKMDNVVATPHMAGTTWDTWARRANFGFENMERIRNGEAPQAVVKNFDSV
ncbi:MAG: lactate dehydrogenase [SAR202 cluster bacterium]|jgi:phosphoglycerate dehydrogenase-like enzyme|nr:MAG: lactate dehydrogenase [SAR202 cluster bacterium]MEC7733408.1 2-hydroxyacid dehydrogenase [Chloroflexota bacterium]|tara:strand:+ start:8910 stop:9890 length:981 start_codon:yes stop_codon:yes gene_type:complete